MSRPVQVEIIYTGHARIPLHVLREAMRGEGRPGSSGIIVSRPERRVVAKDVEPTRLGKVVEQRFLDRRVGDLVPDVTSPLDAVINYQGILYLDVAPAERENLRPPFTARHEK